MLVFLPILIFAIVLVGYEIYKKNIYIWLPSYIRQCLRKKLKINAGEPVHIVFCFVDHFEPRWKAASYEDEVRRIDTWAREYPELASKHKDSDEKYPQHTFFYPAETYRPELLEKLAKLCRDGFGEIEIHLHHDNDTAKGLRKKIEDYKAKLVNHGLLSRDKNGMIKYGFIHGNWALDNSRRDGRWCGVNNELQILKETGCYADFTLPSAPSETQTRKINSIYYAKDDLYKPKSHNIGVDVKVGKEPSGDLMIIQGPLTSDWKKRKWGIFPRIENGKIGVDNPPTRERIDLWIKQHIYVKGQPNWIFVKVYTHGCQEKNFDVLLNKSMDKMFGYLEHNYNDGIKYKLHYVTAREMYNIIKAAEAGRTEDPNLYRNFLVERI